MSQYSSDDVARPRTTKNVYFFKSGDHQFSGVKVAVNLRKHRNLDALLDDLNGKVPGLSHGVRQLRTPNGRTLVTNLSQLEHRGGYICSEKINTNGVVPGVNFDKIKGIKDFQHQPREQLSFQEPSPEPVSPKKKVKKKKKKIARDLDEENESPDERSKAEIIDFEKEVSDEGHEPPPISPKKKKKGSMKKKLSKIPPKSSNSERHDNDYDDDSKSGHENKSAKPSYSAPVTPSEQRRAENSLSPLDDKKLKHVQRRRISSKQINVDEYILPSSNSSMSMKSAFSMKNDDEEMLSAKPPKSKPSSALSTKSHSTEPKRIPGTVSPTVQHDMCLEETRNGRSKSPMNDDNDDKISRKSNEIGEKSDLDEFEDDAYEGKQLSRRNSSLEKNENGNFEHENESENEEYKNKNEHDVGVNETEKEQNEEDNVKEKQQNDDQQKPSKSRMSDEDSNSQIDKTIQKSF